MAHVLMLLGNIFKVNGGLTHAVYRRANALVAAGFDVTIFTSQFHRDFHGLLAEHRRTGTLDPRVAVRNLYEDLEASEELQGSPALEHGYTAFTDPKNPLARRVFNERGEYVAFELREPSGELDFIDRFEAPWVRVAKEIFDSRGQLRKVLYMDRAANVPDFAVTYKANGKAQVSSRLRNGQPISYFSHFDGKEFRSEAGVIVAWMNRCIGAQKNLVVLAEKREMLVPLLDVGGDDAKHVLCLHSSHLDAPYDDPAVVSSSMKAALSALTEKKVEKVVVLTAAQAEDIATLLGDSSLVANIPHYQVAVESRPEDEARNARRVVSLARYHPVKNLTEAIHVIDIVRRSVPDVIYEVYGYGPEKLALQELVVELGLQRNVTLNDHVEDTQMVLKSARVMLSTSHQEGQGLSQIEALAAGTPVVSYDTPYGARENIRDGVDGFVVTYGEGRVEAAAAAVVWLLQDDRLHRSLSESAKEVTSRFSQDDFARSWTSLISELVGTTG
ncbi:Glycosyltransferase [Leucobacter sp. 7(1)]|uniref:glycosyltransferase n=1 Tax=Leucobacter sp. 7(1) TaxID=1255613 RepID=UPI00097EFBA1|nr:glycosyltransferase [Leucobacter sp. 7(1)]SJN11867.1 Glycosyltransferase [Leucobacter sp. 7(1)]